MKKNIEPVYKKEVYDGWLLSTSLIKRSLAVAGHYFIAYLLIFAAVFAVALVIAVFDLILNGGY